MLRRRALTLAMVSRTSFSATRAPVSTRAPRGGRPVSRAADNYADTLQLAFRNQYVRLTYTPTKT